MHQHGLQFFHFVRLENHFVSRSANFIFSIESSLDKDTHFDNDVLLMYIFRLSIGFHYNFDNAGIVQNFTINPEIKFAFKLLLIMYFIILYKINVFVM